MIPTILFTFRYIATSLVIALILYGVLFFIGRAWALNLNENEYGRTSAMTVVMYVSCPLALIFSPFVTLLILFMPYGKKLISEH
jgi:hypothetical protein